METKPVTLKNGTTEVEPLVAATMMSLRKLFDEEPIVLFDLVSRCRDDSYEWFGDAEKECKDLRLVQSDNTIHRSIKNIILSATEGDGMDMTLVSPYAEPPNEE